MSEMQTALKSDTTITTRTSLEAAAPTILRIGDAVLWRSAWGTKPAQTTTVTAIERVQPASGEKHGQRVSAMDWADVPSCAVVDLQNGHWAYGKQIEPVRR